MTALLIFGFCLLLQTDKQVVSQRVQLGIYQDSFDDQYVGCADKMESLAPDILKVDRQANEELDAAWLDASETWPTRKTLIKSLPAGFKDEYGIALLVYTNMTIPVYKQLNRAVREYGTNPPSFAFHALHFYLTRALALLRGGCGGQPWHTYRGASRIMFEPPPNPGDPVRLSQFASSSADIKQAQQFGNASFFNITTCFGADIQNLSYFPSQKEVLIPVDEVFHVARYVEWGHKFDLQSSGRRCSFYNCAYLGGRKRQNCTYSSAPETQKNLNKLRAPPLAVSGIVLTLFMNALIG
ncbi:PREDICTED: ecto-ADP-ribosyltransferase 5-like [Nanorana parkeri]|uniref:ecto-ADP-ribosyltransferase 5-like n=1 Tax=Nanorana parkeri TaxID=125878 RepID=UPI00085439EE|nr:PREDICTED: ecto-ADP-ribosyltransferase 5-like [Nanorana parkeri]